MEYRRLGKWGLRVSALGFGSWVTFGNQLDEGLATECMAAAFEGGVNFFDNAEVYARGESERVMGSALKRLGWAREDFVVSTKFFSGIHAGTNTSNTLNRKYLLQAIGPSLDRLGLEFVDLIYCHSHDPATPIQETVWAMHEIIERGEALYWGTSNWPAAAILEAAALAELHHLHPPVVEQPQYNLLTRHDVEDGLASVCDEVGIGLTTWSPLAFGVLTGKYLDGVPDASRARAAGVEWLTTMANEPTSRRAAQVVVEVAADLGCPPAQVALAWCLLNPRVSSVITGASHPDQVTENLGALDVVGQLGSEVRARLEAVGS